MNIEITRDPQKRIEMAKTIVMDKNAYYTQEVLDSYREIIRKNTKISDPEELENELYKTIYYYWAYGCPVSEYYYLGFPNKTHEEIKKYVTTREKVIYRNRLNKIEDAHILNNKWDTYLRFKDYYHREVIIIENESDYPFFSSFVDRHHEFVIKPTDMGGGSGVHKVSIDSSIAEEEKRKLFFEILSENKKNKKKYNRGQENNVILEEMIIQVPEMAVIHPDSVNGVRVTTVRVEDKVNILYPWFKIGRNGQFLTSAVYGTLDACIDAETGKVNTLGYSETNEKFDIHPDTGVPILGFQIPQWEKLIETVTELASSLNTIHYVGWDMVLTEKGWVLMEGNFSGDFMWQMCLERGTKKEFEELIGWKLDKQFWWEA